MLLVSIAVVVLVLLLIIRRWMPNMADDAPLGRMSPEWLAEYRASHSS